MPGGGGYPFFKLTKKKEQNIAKCQFCAIPSAALDAPYTQFVPAAHALKLPESWVKGTHFLQTPRWEEGVPNFHGDCLGGGGYAFLRALFPRNTTPLIRILNSP